MTFGAEKPGQQRTTDWFLAKIDDFKAELEETIKSTRAITETDHPATLALSTHKYYKLSSSDKLKGFITVKGSQIVKGELKIKVNHYNRGNVLVKSIDSNSPIVLQQVKSFNR